MKVSRKSRMRYKINSSIMLLLLLICAVLLAWFSYRYDQQFDWTASGRHSLSTASIETLKRMSGPLQITSYASDNPQLREIIRNTVKRYQLVKSDIELEFINQVAVPQQVAELGISVDGEMLLQYQGRVEHVKSDNEEEFTNALSRLLRGSDRWLTVIEGHGERNALGQANHDLGIWLSTLGQRGFSAQPLNLTQVKAIPDNTAVLIISQPTVDYLPGEIDIIRDYLDNGGNLLWLAEPTKMHGLETIAEQLGIEFLPGIVIDYVGQLLGSNDPTIGVASEVNYQAHTALQGFKLTSLFPGIVAINNKPSSDWRAQPMITSGEHTWSERTALSEEIQFDEGVDELGPLNIAMGLQRELTVGDEGNETTVNQRVIVVGDGDFLSNQFLANSGNTELGYRLINWLSHDDDFISIPAKTADDLHLELSKTSKLVIIFGFLILLPLLLFAVGLWVWWRRRQQ